MFDRLLGADVEKLMYADLFLLKKKDKGQIEEIKKSWLNELLYCDVKVPCYKEQDFLFFRTLRRDDYRNLFHSISSQCFGDKIHVEDFITRSSIMNLDASDFLKNNYGLMKYFRSYESDLKICLAIRFIYYCYIVSKVAHFSVKVLVTFSDMQPIDYLSTLYFKGRGVKTVTLQHGLYVEYKDIDTVNIVNYINQPSDYFLAWGDNTKKLIERYNCNSQVKICGKPNIRRATTSHSKTILIIFDQEVFSEKNIEMYNIVSGFSLGHDFDVFVKFHPHNNIAAYEKKLKNLNSTNNVYGHSIVIGHTSSLLFELHAIGQLVFQYKTNIPTIDLAENCQFDSVNSLGRRFASKENVEINDDVIKYISDDSSEKYKAFFDSLLPSGGGAFFSIIIPCFNSLMTLWKSIDSLKEQSFENFEVIIMDGQSTDATVAFALSYIGEDSRFKIYSSEDSGTYDAMNKGVSKASGEWVYFMGSDDRFNDSDVLEDVHSSLLQCERKDIGMIYGSVEVVGDVKWAKNGTIYDGEFDTNKIKQKNICHQAIFYNRKDKLKHLPYNLKYKLCADWDMNLKVWSSHHPLYINRVIAKFLAGGQSTDGSDPLFGKDFKANIKNYFC
ncbi:glycosyltransferase family 2 protein [Agarivorans sp. MS3-6]